MQRFVDAIAEQGLEAVVVDGLVTFRVVPVGGAHDGEPVETGVSLEELGSWPQVPPHWVHLPEDIEFPKTNSKPSSKEGWLMHSRGAEEWGNAPPGIEWVSHVRAVLGEATA